MHTRRVLSHVTGLSLLLFLATITVQVSSAYPIRRESHDQAIRNLDGGVDSPNGIAPSTFESELSTKAHVHWYLPRGEPSSAKVAPILPSHLSWFVNKDGRRRQRIDGQIWGPEAAANHVERKPEWLDFEIVDFPGDIPSGLNMYSRTTTVQGLKEDQDKLLRWLSDDDQWRSETDIHDLQKSILNNLQSLTEFDLRHATRDLILKYEPAVLGRMLVAAQMYEAPLSWGKFKLHLQDDIKWRLAFYARVMKETYHKDIGYSPRELDVPTLIKRLEFEVPKKEHAVEKEKGAVEKKTTDAKTHP